MALLEIENLIVAFPSPAATGRAVDGISIAISAGESLGVVGESGSGKSLTMLAAMGLVPYPGHVTVDRLTFQGRDLMRLSSRERRHLAGSRMAMIFQDPMTSLNPCFTVGFQLIETLRIHEKIDRKAARWRAIALLEQVGIPAAESRMGAFPHQLSGGMNQRVMIAMAIACQPDLLIADEPTTALDVTVQAQILELMKDLQREFNSAIIVITHDLGVVAETCETVVVMYGGQCVEQGSVKDIFYNPEAGLPRGERELAAAATSRFNGCIYCASVHARHSATYSKRADDVQRLLDEGVGADLGERWNAIIDACVGLSATPVAFASEHVERLRRAGLDDLAIADVIHAAAFFNWANRLMLSLGEPALPPKA